MLWEVDGDQSAQATARAGRWPACRGSGRSTPRPSTAATATPPPSPPPRPAWALDRGARHVLLYTDLANPTTNRLYPRLGFRPRTTRWRPLRSEPVSSARSTSRRGGASRSAQFGRIRVWCRGSATSRREPGPGAGRPGGSRRTGAPSALARLGLTGPARRGGPHRAGLVGRRQARRRRRERHVGAGPQPRPGPRAARRRPARRARTRRHVAGARRRAARATSCCAGGCSPCSAARRRSPTTSSPTPTAGAGSPPTRRTAAGRRHPHRARCSPPSAPTPTPRPRGARGRRGRG